MQNQIQVYTYEGQEVEFDLSHDGIMINATEMAKPFKKLVSNFLKLEQTIKFMDFLVQDCNSNLEKPLTKDDFIKIVHGGRHNGTWMHRYVALKFAAWLDPSFEFWVIRTVDAILIGQSPIPSQLIEERNQAVALKNEAKADVNRLESELLVQDNYNELIAARGRVKTFTNKQRILSRNIIAQLDIFTPTTFIAANENAIS